MRIKHEIGNFLEELGLNRAEIAVYSANLELGSAEASKIAAIAGLNRITAYEALKRLSKKGFIRIRAKKNNKIKYFVPIEYQELIEKLEAKRKSVEDSIEKAKNLRKEFQAHFNESKEKPIVLFYEGKDGIKDVLNDTLAQKPNEILSFSSVESLELGFDKDYMENYWKRRVDLNIPTRGIVPKTEKALKDFSKERNQKEFRELKLISPNTYDFKNEIDIYGDNIGITSAEPGNEHGIIIRSKSIADSLRSVFEALWQQR